VSSRTCVVRCVVMRQMSRDNVWITWHQTGVTWSVNITHILGLFFERIESTLPNGSVTLSVFYLIAPPTWAKLTQSKPDPFGIVNSIGSKNKPLVFIIRYAYVIPLQFRDVDVWWCVSATIIPPPIALFLNSSIWVVRLASVKQIWNICDNLNTTRTFVFHNTDISSCPIVDHSAPKQLILSSVDILPQR